MHKPRVENIYTGLSFKNPFICTITLSLSCYPIKFRFMLGQMVLERVSFIEDSWIKGLVLRNIMVGKVLGCWNSSGEFLKV
jgi:hypothetical protein